MALALLYAAPVTANPSAKTDMTTADGMALRLEVPRSILVCARGARTQHAALASQAPCAQDSDDSREREVWVIGLGVEMVPE